MNSQAIRTVGRACWCRRGGITDSPSVARSTKASPMNEVVTTLGVPAGAKNPLLGQSKLYPQQEPLYPCDSCDLSQWEKEPVRSKWDFWFVTRNFRR